MPYSRPTFTEERKLLAQGFSLVAGVDEAGCGAWAGHVYAGAVILSIDKPISGLRDSKTLSWNQRMHLAQKIKERAIAWSIGVASHTEVDRLNVRAASNLAMQRAVLSLSPLPDHLLSDAFVVKGVPMPCKNLIRGDGKVRSIAAASILAKVERDLYMRQMEARYPGYGFHLHVGYGTKRHQNALKELGISPIHRRTYKPIKQYL